MTINGFASSAFQPFNDVFVLAAGVASTIGAVMQGRLDYTSNATLSDGATIVFTDIASPLVQLAGTLF